MISEFALNVVLKTVILVKVKDFLNVTLAKMDSICNKMEKTKLLVNSVPTIVTLVKTNIIV